jgi:hypothetical protein
MRSFGTSRNRFDFQSVEGITNVDDVESEQPVSQPNEWHQAAAAQPSKSPERYVQLPSDFLLGSEPNFIGGGQDIIEGLSIESPFRSAIHRVIHIGNMLYEASKILLDLKRILEQGAHSCCLRSLLRATDMQHAP